MFCVQCAVRLSFSSSFTLHSGSLVWFGLFRYVSFVCPCRFFLCFARSFVWSFVRSFHSFSMDHMNWLGSISFPIYTNILTHSSSVDLFGCFVCIQNIILIFSIHRSLSLSIYLCLVHACFVFIFLHLLCKCVCNTM